MQWNGAWREERGIERKREKKGERGRGHML
jgi:hypothetical protein